MFASKKGFRSSVSRALVSSWLERRHLSWVFILQAVWDCRHLCTHSSVQFIRLPSHVRIHMPGEENELMSLTPFTSHVGSSRPSRPPRSPSEFDLVVSASYKCKIWWQFHFHPAVVRSVALARTPSPQPEWKSTPRGNRVLLTYLHWTFVRNTALPFRAHRQPESWCHSRTAYLGSVINKVDNSAPWNLRQLQNLSLFIDYLRRNGPLFSL